MTNKKQHEILASDKRIKLYEGHRGGISRLMTTEELEVLRQSFTPDKFKELYLNEYERQAIIVDHNEWLREASGHYKNLSITPEGKLSGMKR